MVERPTALVTGASSGIGARTCQLLSSHGFRVLGAARRVERVAALGAVVPIPLDLADPTSIDAAGAAVLDRVDHLDVLVNCAGYGEFGSIEELDLEAARRQLQVNVLGAMQLTQLVLPNMRAAGRGRIVNVSSLAGEFSSPLAGWYHASKFALEALSDALRQEVGPFGVHVTVVQPSYVASDWHDTAVARLVAASAAGPYAGMVESLRRYFASAAVARQMSTVDHVAEVVCTAATTPRPRTRYRVGRGSSTAVVAATLLPDRVFDRLTRWQFGYPRYAGRLGEGQPATT